MSVRAMIEPVAALNGSDPAALSVQCWSGRDLAQEIPRLTAWWQRQENAPLNQHPKWLCVLERAFGQQAYLLEAARGSESVAHLPLIYMKSLLFGKFLVSLPYLNSAGLFGSDQQALRALVEAAVNLAERLDVQHLELRHETPFPHELLPTASLHKVHMRRALPSDAVALWSQLGPKVRNQVRKAEKHQFHVHWGGQDLLAAFYAVFSRNMRDLGTPVYSQSLFRNILEQFPQHAEICAVFDRAKPVSAALLLHGPETTEVPSASSLREYRNSCVNMLLYWRLLERALIRSSREFDFGRSTIDSATFRFKAQWGAVPQPAIWQYHIRRGNPELFRKENGRNQGLIRLWKRLPVPISCWLGPPIVRGIP